MVVLAISFVWDLVANGSKRCLWSFLVCHYQKCQADVELSNIMVWLCDFTNFILTSSVLISFASSSSTQGRDIVRLDLLEAGWSGNHCPGDRFKITWWLIDKPRLNLHFLASVVLASGHHLERPSMWLLLGSLSFTYNCRQGLSG